MEIELEGDDGDGGEGNFSYADFPKP